MATWNWVPGVSGLFNFYGYIYIHILLLLLLLLYLYTYTLTTTTMFYFLMLCGFNMHLVQAVKAHLSWALVLTYVSPFVQDKMGFRLGKE